MITGQTDLFGIEGIGRCWTCAKVKEGCDKPKHRDKHPELGCTDWEDAKGDRWKMAIAIGEKER